MSDWEVMDQLKVVNGNKCETANDSVFSQQSEHGSTSVIHLNHLTNNICKTLSCICVLISQFYFQIFCSCAPVL